MAWHSYWTACPLKMGPTGCPKMSVTTNKCCIISRRAQTSTIPWKRPETYFWTLFSKSYSVLQITQAAYFIMSLSLVAVAEVEYSGTGSLHSSGILSLRFPCTYVIWHMSLCSSNILQLLTLASRLRISSFNSCNEYEFFQINSVFKCPPQTIITVLEIWRTRGTQPMGYQQFAKYLFYSIHWDLYCMAHGNVSYEGIIYIHFFSQFPEEWCHTVNQMWWSEFTVSLKKIGFVILCALTGHHSPTRVMQKNVMNCKGSYGKQTSINSGCLHPYLM
jgi:hypothetical protein